MRNLKKVLALTLAVALVLSLSINASAATFKDNTSIKGDYSEAVDMLVELGIINGFPDGEFKPEGNLTRAQYLKMLYVIVEGRGTDDSARIYKDMPGFPFSDIYKGHWAEGYTKAGYNKKWIDGYGDGTFRPDNTLTGYEAMKLSLVALGYSSEIEGFAGLGWEGNILRVAGKIDLLDGIKGEDLTQPLSRQAACQLLNNTLFANTVKYNLVSGNIAANDLTEILDKNGNTVSMAAAYLDMLTIRGVVIANEWASVEKTVDTADKGKTALVVARKDIPGAYTSDPDRDEIITVPFTSGVEKLGHEVIAYVKYAAPKDRTKKEISKVYGAVKETGRTQITDTVVAEDKIVQASKTGKKGSEFKLAYNDAVDGAKDFCSVLYSMGITEWTKFETKVDGKTFDGETDKKYATLTRNFVADALKVDGDIDDEFKKPTGAITAGSEITAIDSTGDGKYDYVFVNEVDYAKVDEIDGDKLTALVGDSNKGDFGGKVIDDIAIKNIDGGKDLKVGDRIIVASIGEKNNNADDTFTAKVLLPTTGTLTASRSSKNSDGDTVDGSIAVISGKSYKQSLLKSWVTKVVDITGTDSYYNASKEYYIYLDGILEGPTDEDTDFSDKVWALVADSYMKGGNAFADSTKQVSLTLENGTTKVYDLKSYKYRASADSNSFTDAAFIPAYNDDGKKVTKNEDAKIGIGPRDATYTAQGKDNPYDDGPDGGKAKTTNKNAISYVLTDGTDADGAINPNVIVMAKISSDGKSVDLWDVANPELEGTAGVSAGELAGMTPLTNASYTAGKTSMNEGASSYRIMSSTVTFVYNTVSEKWSAFKGTSMKGFGAANVFEGSYVYLCTSSGSFIKNPKNSVAAMAIYSDKLKGASGDTKYGMVISSTSQKNSSGDMYYTLEMFVDGAIKKLNVDEDLNSVVRYFDGRTFVSYTLNSSDVISSIDEIRPTLTSPKLDDTDAGKVFAGLYSRTEKTVIDFINDDMTDMFSLDLSKNVEYFSVTTEKRTNVTTVKSLSSLSSASEDRPIVCYIIMDEDNTSAKNIEVVQVYVDLDVTYTDKNWSAHQADVFNDED